MSTIHTEDGQSSFEAVVTHLISELARFADDGRISFAEMVAFGTILFDAYERWDSDTGAEHDAKDDSVY